MSQDVRLRKMNTQKLINSSATLLHNACSAFQVHAYMCYRQKNYLRNNTLNNVLGRLAAREATLIYQFVTNSNALFHL